MRARSVALAAAAAGGAYYMMRRRRAHARAPVAHAGIADVDPVPLAQVAGEGIDPEATDEAHREISEQRAKLDAVTRLP